MNGPVGWFPDPEGGNGLRYFDGKEWAQVAPPPVALPAAAAPPVNVTVNNTNVVGGTVGDGRSHPWLLLLCLSPIWLPVAIGIWVGIGPGPIFIGAFVIAVIVALVQKNKSSARAQAELAMRAEIEDGYNAKGDPRGTYGKFPPPEFP